MTMKDKIFIDTNILIYIIDEDSPFHEESKESFSKIEKNSQLWISRQIIREYSVITTRTDLIAKPLNSKELIDDIIIFENLFTIADDTYNTTKSLLELINKYNISGKKIHDANIVATMIENNIEKLLTKNNNDFKRYEEILLV